MYALVVWTRLLCFVTDSRDYHPQYLPDLQVTGAVLQRFPVVDRKEAALPGGIELVLTSKPRVRVCILVYMMRLFSVVYLSSSKPHAIY